MTTLDMVAIWKALRTLRFGRAANQEERDIVAGPAMELLQPGLEEVGYTFKDGSIDMVVVDESEEVPTPEAATSTVIGVHEPERAEEVDAPVRPHRKLTFKRRNEE